MKNLLKKIFLWPVAAIVMAVILLVLVAFTAFLLISFVFLTIGRFFKFFETLCSDFIRAFFVSASKKVSDTKVVMRIRSIDNEEKEKTSD